MLCRSRRNELASCSGALQMRLCTCAPDGTGRSPPPAMLCPQATVSNGRCPFGCVAGKATPAPPSSPPHRPVAPSSLTGAVAMQLPGSLPLFTWLVRNWNYRVAAEKYESLMQGQVAQREGDLVARFRAWHEDALENDGQARAAWVP